VPPPRCLCVIVLAAVLLGCGGASGRVPVTGTVTFNDKPLADAVVTFYPEGDTAGLGGAARTGPDGRYTLTAAQGGDGLHPGEYAVVISRLLRPDGTPLPPNVPPIESDASETLPAAYSSRDASTLKRTVSKDTTSYDFALRPGGK
jgi:hypothetical protein